MIAAPWYLSSLGILLIIVGAIAGSVLGASSRTGIDPRMSDAEIARRLERRSSPGFPGLVVYAGLLCLAIGVGWRLVRPFL